MRLGAEATLTERWPLSRITSFELYGQGTGLPSMAGETRGKAAVAHMMKELKDNFRFSDWQEVSFVVEGHKAALRWRANVTFTHD